MAETTTLARPYAQAVFALAQEKAALKPWSETLSLLAAIVSDAGMRAFIDNPKTRDDEVYSVINDVAGGKLDTHASNLLRLLVENGRMRILPEISEIYGELRADAERTVQAEMVSAFEVSSAQQAAIIKALKARTGRDVNLDCRVDETLVGGAVIRAGDLVIDGTVSNHMDKLALALTR